MWTVIIVGAAVLSSFLIVLVYCALITASRADDAAERWADDA